MTDVPTRPQTQDTSLVHDLRGYLRKLDDAGLLRHVAAEVELDGEIGAICYRSLVRNGPGICFDSIAGYPGLPLVANIMYRPEQLALAFNCEADWSVLHRRVADGMANRLESVVVTEAACQEVVLEGDDAVLSRFPTPLWHELDGGRYIATTAGVVTRDPKLGFMNMGQYRAMIIDDTHTTVKIQGDFPVGAKPPAGSNYGGPGDRSGVIHILENEAEGKPTPCAIVLGMDPLLTLSAGTAVPADENNFAEYEAAGAWRGAPTELVKCRTSDLLVPARAEIVIEGEIVPGIRHEDGPHGESTGFYNKNFEAFVFEVKCITHRRHPISFGLICGRIEDYPRPLMRSESIREALVRKTGLTSIKEVYFPDAGARGVILIRAHVERAGEAREIMAGAWANMRYRWVIVVDDDCDLRDWNDVMWRVVTTVDPREHVVLSPERTRARGRPGQLDLVEPAHGMGIDATTRHKSFEFPLPPAAKPSPELLDSVAGRWRELGLP